MSNIIVKKIFLSILIILILNASLFLADNATKESEEEDLGIPFFPRDTSIGTITITVTVKPNEQIEFKFMNIKEAYSNSDAKLINLDSSIDVLDIYQKNIITENGTAIVTTDTLFYYGLEDQSFRLREIWWYNSFISTENKPQSCVLEIYRISTNGIILRSEDYIIDDNFIKFNTLKKYLIKQMPTKEKYKVKISYTINNISKTIMDRDDRKVYGFTVRFFSSEVQQFEFVSDPENDLIFEKPKEMILPYKNQSRKRIFNNVKNLEKQDLEIEYSREMTIPEEVSKGLPTKLITEIILIVITYPIIFYLGTLFQKKRQNN